MGLPKNNSKGLPTYRTRVNEQTGERTYPSNVGAGGTFRGETLDERLAADANRRARETSDAERAKFEASVNAHNFWTKPNQFYDPKLQFRFTVEIPGLALEDARPNPGDSFADTKDQSGDVIWYVKSCDKPGYTVIDKAEGQSQPTATNLIQRY